jgi:integrase
MADQHEQASEPRVASGSPLVITPEMLLPGTFEAAPFVPLASATAGRSVRIVDLSRLDVSALQPKAYLHADLPIALAVTLYLVMRGSLSSTDTFQTGLRRLCDYHALERWSGLTLVDMEQDFERIRSECVDKNARRLEEAQKIANEHQRERRLQAIQHNTAADGAGAVNNYKDAVLSLGLFLKGLTRVEQPSPLTGSNRGPKNTGLRRQGLRETQMLRLWDAAARERDSELAFLILDLLRETACRRASICSFNLEDMDWARGAATFRTKGGRVHSTVLSRDLLERIASRAVRQGWDGQPIQDYDPTSKKGSINGTPALRLANGTRLTPKNVVDLFSRCDERINRPEEVKITAHVLRHTTITQVERICGEEAAARWAGHRRGPKSRADQTSVYVKWMLDERIALFNFMYPQTPYGAHVPAVISQRLAQGKSGNTKS